MELLICRSELGAKVEDNMQHRQRLNNDAIAMLSGQAKLLPLYHHCHALISGELAAGHMQACFLHYCATYHEIWLCDYRCPKQIPARGASLSRHNPCQA